MLHVHRAERADALVDSLRELLLAPGADPFAPEVVAVPTRGMERWLAQQLSTGLGATPGRRDGICANVEFPSLRRLVGDAVATASGVEPDEDPWLPEHAVWPLLAVVDSCAGEPWLRTLSAYLGRTTDPPDEARLARRFSTVRHLADLFDRYALHRPAMLTAWARGDDLDAAGTPLPADAVWQAELWRRLRTAIALPGPAERIEAACARLRDDPAAVDLPPRVSLFGLTRLPTGYLQVLRALAAGRDVHLHLLHPSASLWDAVAYAAPAVTRRADDPTADLPRNQLLASWGHDAREMQVAIESGAGERVDHHHEAPLRPGTLLARIQSDVRANRRPPGPPLPGAPDERMEVDADDRSLQVHACHGRARQVEVVRDAILHALAADPTLEPRDVIVMCPDIDAFAPLVQAVFGAAELEPDEDAAPQADLRVRLADRSMRHTNPVLGVVAELLDLAEARVTASEVLDLADREPVRRRFDLDDDALTRMQDWIADTGIRWGLDADHRAPFQLEGLPRGTWRAGIDRVLVGVAMTEDERRLFGDVLPFDDVESGAIGLAGRFAELVARLRDALAALSVTQPIAAWASAIAGAADALTLTSERDAWQRAELQRLLDDLTREAAGGGDTALALPEVRALLAERLMGRPTRANFRTGSLTVCTLVPMRSVPHRVVCLLGLDDGVFPRKAPRDGDDLMLDDPHVGERDPRTEDRQLLLDALLAATDRLVVTYTGNDERTNTPRPPAVPVGELLDVVDATVRDEGRERVVVRHPLQPFDPRNFAGPAPWSFDPVTLDGARALTGSRSERGAFLARPLPARESDVIELEDLARFVHHPVRAFLRQRLNIGLTDGADEIEDRLRVELDGLQRWEVGQRLLEARLEGVEGRTAILAEIARGTLPPGVLGAPVVDAVYPTVDAIVAATERLRPGGSAPEPFDVRVPLPDGRVLSGTVAGVGDDVLLMATFSRLAPKHRIAAWVRLLALTASHPARAFAAASVGRAERASGISVAQIRPLSTDAALDQLLTIVDLYDRGMREPLPIYCATSAAYARAAEAGFDAVTAARRAWQSEWKFDKEDKQVEHRLVLGGVREFDELLVEAPRAGEDWGDDEPTRLGTYARRLWAGLLACEEVTSG